MAFFLIYNSALGTPTARPVLRWGECPADMVAGQVVDANDVAVTIASLAVFDGSTDDIFETTVDYAYTFNPSTDAVATATRTSNDEYVLNQGIDRVKHLLRETEWTQTIEGKFSDAKFQAWIDYRAALRALLLDAGFPEDVTFPTPPDAIGGANGLQLPETESDPLWKRIYRRGNIVGPVSKTAGLFPTGALIEEGSNANGRYRRLAGGLGTQVCWHRLSSSDSADVVWTFPAEFAGDNVSVTVTPLVASGLAIMAPIVRPPGASSIAFSIVNASGSRIERSCDLFAIGQWT